MPRRPIVPKRKSDRQLAMIRAYDIIDRIREHGFKDGGKGVKDGQIWQACLDTQSADPDTVVLHLLEHAIEGRTAPSTAYIIERNP